MRNILLAVLLAATLPASAQDAHPVSALISEKADLAQDVIGILQK